jgi:hypothetical protein
MQFARPRTRARAACRCGASPRGVALQLPARGGRGAELGRVEGFRKGRGVISRFRVSWSDPGVFAVRSEAARSCARRRARPWLPRGSMAAPPGDVGSPEALAAVIKNLCRGGRGGARGALEAFTEGVVLRSGGVGGAAAGRWGAARAGSEGACRQRKRAIGARCRCRWLPRAQPRQAAPRPSRPARARWAGPVSCAAPLLGAWTPRAGLQPRGRRC